MAEGFVTVAKLRAEMARVLAELPTTDPVYLIQRGQPRAVLIDVDRYRSLVDQLEHLDDSVEALLARERRETGAETARPLAEVIAERRGEKRKKPVHRRRAVVPR